MNTFAKALIASATLALAGTAAAVSTTQLQYQTTLGIELDTSESDGYLSGAMQYVDGNGKSFAAFCIEMAQPHAALGSQSYTIGSFTGSQAQWLQGLFSSSYASVTTDQQRAAFQTAIWEITHESSGTLDVDGGNFFFLAQTNGGNDAAFIGLANSYLDAALSYKGTAKYTLTKLSNDSFQDLVTVSAVPEPETYAMLLAGLGVVGFVARRRKRA